ncbi:MAG: CpsD/CapB family tyrosine-protein kinase [Acidobacteriota bacterium]
MGKVHEALSRAQNASDELDLFDEVEEGQDGQSEPAPEKFHFMRYSLGATTTMVAKDQPKRGPANAALAPREPARPGREVTLIPERVDPHLVAFFNYDPRATQEYNRLALSLISKAAERGLKRVLVASAQEGEGRTCVTLNLACALARARQRVLVVDCDLLNPSVMRLLGLNPEIGLYEAFDRAMPPGAAVITIRPYGFNVLPTIRPVDNPAELLAAPGFWKMLQSFDADHDFILFDSSPLATGGDSSLLVRFTDSTLMVVRAGQTSSAQMAKALAPFAQDDILGVVINRAD